MKKTLLYLCILISGLTTGSCRKPCYTCYATVLSANRIDTFYHYGQVRYDTSWGFNLMSWTFTSCEINSHYHYGDLSFSPSFKIDTIIDCQQNNY